MKQLWNTFFNKNAFEVHLFPLLILSFLWTYGYSGALTKLSLNLQIIISTSLIGILFFLFFSYEKLFAKNNNIDIVVISRKNIKVFLLILSLTLIFSFDYLFFSLVGDELSHSLYSQMHTLQLLHGISNIIPNFILQQKVLIIIWVISGFILLSIIIFLNYLKKTNFKHKYIIFTVLLILFFRGFFIINGGLDPSHPPFRLFPLWLSSSIFSPSVFSFRLPGIIALSLIGFVIYKVLKTKLSSTITLWLSVFTLITIPLLWHNSYLVTPSIWAALFSILFLLTFQEADFYKLNFFSWFLLLTVFILMRQSLVYITVPILILFVMERRGLLIKKWKETIFILSPFLVALPFLIRSLLLGTPAQEILSNELQLTLIEKLIHVIGSGMLKDIILNNFEIWTLFLIFSLITTKKNRLRNFIIILAFISSSVIIFYSIRPVLWGEARYQSEYIVPLIILGAVRVITIVYESNYQVLKYSTPVVLICLLFYNI